VLLLKALAVNGATQLREKKEACMSIMTRVDFVGEMLMSAVMVLRVRRGPEGWRVEGCA
jgi:hypothetical protein